MVSDSIIYVIDTKDSTNTKTYCYDYRGRNLVNSFIPSNSGFAQISFARYLFGKSEFVVYDASHYNLTFFSSAGDLLNQEPLIDDWSLYTDIAEFSDTLFFNVTNFYDENKQQSLRIYKQVRDIKPVLYRIVPINLKVLKRKPYQQPLLIDSNRNDAIITCQINANIYHLNYMDTSESRKFEIIKPNKSRLFNIFAGWKYVVLCFVNPNQTKLSSIEIFGLQGQLIGKLDTKYWRNSTIIDIVGNKIISFDGNKSKFSIDEIVIDKSIQR
jgi:hypothetical protein